MCWGDDQFSSQHDAAARALPALARRSAYFCRADCSRLRPVEAALETWVIGPSCEGRLARQGGIVPWQLACGGCALAPNALERKPTTIACIAEVGLTRAGAATRQPSREQACADKTVTNDGGMPTCVVVLAAWFMEHNWRTTYRLAIHRRPVIPNKALRRNPWVTGVTDRTPSRPPVAGGAPGRAGRRRGRRSIAEVG